MFEKYIRNRGKNFYEAYKHQSKIYSDYVSQYITNPKQKLLFEKVTSYIPKLLDTHNILTENDALKKLVDVFSDSKQKRPPIILQKGETP
jgi:hypothetical protein